MTAHHHLASPAAYSLAPSATGSPSKMAHHHRQHPGLSKFHRHSSSSPGGSHGRTKRGRNSSGWLVNQLPVIVLTATNMIIISMLYRWAWAPLSAFPFAFPSWLYSAAVASAQVQ